jgi:hypothetical protein
MKGRPDLSFAETHRVPLREVPLRLDHKAVRIDAQMADLIALVKVQNFVPVTDDMNRFIGIVRRSDIIDYCAGVLMEKGLLPKGGPNAATAAEEADGRRT